MFKAVIFDWDGTLADTQHSMVRAFKDALKTVSCNVSNGFIQKKIGIGARNTIADALKAANISFNNETLDRLIKTKTNSQLAQAADVTLFDGALPLLNSLHHEVKMALASMNNRAVIDKLLEETKVKPYFEVVVTADEVIEPKPNPEIFLRCSRKLRCPSERCVVIEDSIFGVRAAKKAKMKCIAVSSGAYSMEELEHETPELVVSSLLEKGKMLRFILGR